MQAKDLNDKIIFRNVATDTQEQSKAVSEKTIFQWTQRMGRKFI